MRTDTQLASIEILKALSEDERPAGAARLAMRLRARGYDLSPRTVRAHLLALDEQGLTRTVSRRLGRELTKLGRSELANANIFDKLGFVAARVDDLAYRTTYNSRTGRGTVVANLALIRQRDLSRALYNMEPVVRSGLGVGKIMGVARARERIGTFEIPIGSVGISTVCSVSINGALLSRGIPVTSRFGGIVEIRAGRPVRFVDAIEYRGTSIDPLEVFMRAGMTSVRDCAATGNGIVGASFREVPTGALPAARRLLEELEARNLGGVLAYGEGSRPLLDMPVTEGRTAFIVMGGLNPIAAICEAGIPVSTHPLSSLVNIDTFLPIDDAVILGKQPYPYVD